jgi:myo-inositol-1(or 4)-monophosphatase
MEPSLLLKRLRTVADVAGTIVLRHYGRIDFSLKPDQSVLTEVDGEVEDYLRLQLAEILPEASFIGEESAGDPSLLARAQNAEWVWVVDPIDGTAAFVDGMDTFCVCIGLLRDGQPYAGAVSVPAMGHRYSAVRGQGAWYDGSPIQVLHVEPDEDRAVLCISRNAHRYLDIRYKGKAHSLGSTALHFLLVARGAAVAAIARAHVWDHVASAAILLEAGGCIQHLGGNAVDWTDILDGREISPPLLGVSPKLVQVMSQAIYWTDEKAETPA